MPITICNIACIVSTEKCRIVYFEFWYFFLKPTACIPFFVAFASLTLAEKVFKNENLTYKCLRSTPLTVINNVKDSIE